MYKWDLIFAVNQFIIKCNWGVISVIAIVDFVGGR